MPPRPGPGPGIEQQGEPFPEPNRSMSPMPDTLLPAPHAALPEDIAAGLRPLCAAAGLVLALDEVGFDVWLTPVPDDAEVAFWHAPVPDGVRPWLRATYALTVG